MTFEQWWAENKPSTPGQLRQKRMAMLAWNAAIEEARRWLAAPVERTEETDLMAKVLKVTPINGVMQKLSQ
jgi:hypothetical protein